MVSPHGTLHRVSAQSECRELGCEPPNCTFSSSACGKSAKRKRTRTVCDEAQLSQRPVTPSDFEKQRAFSLALGPLEKCVLPLGRLSLCRHLSPRPPYGPPYDSLVKEKYFMVSPPDEEEYEHRKPKRIRLDAVSRGKGTLARSGAPSRGGRVEFT